MRLAPSEYFARQCWISFEIDEQTLPALAPFIGERPDRVGIGLPPSRRHLPRRGDHPAAHPRPARRRAPRTRILGANAAAALPLAASATSGLAGGRRRRTRPRRADHAGRDRRARRPPATATPRCTSPPTGVALSYAELDRLSDAVAARPGRPGHRARRPGRPAAALGAAYAVAYVAAAKIGAVTAGVNDKLSPPERRRCLEIARPRLVLASTALAAATDLAHHHRGGGGRRGRRRRRPRPRCWPSCAARAAAARRSAPDPDRAVAVVFTSGTTGEPKGAVFGEPPARRHRRQPTGDGAGAAGAGVWHRPRSPTSGT